MRSELYPASAILVPIAIRLIPEIISPYPVGFDTIAYYIPIMISRLALQAGPAGYFGGTILLQLLLTEAYALVGNAFLIMKIAAALLLGFLGMATYLLGRNFLKWNRQRALLLALFVCSYFVTLRLSWDLHRNILGLAFALLTLAFLEDPRPRAHYVLLPLFAALAVMTHESGSILVALFAVASLSLNMRYRNIRNYLPLSPALLLIILQLVLRQNLLSQIQGPATNPNLLDGFLYNLGFLFFAFWLILPVAIIGVRRGTPRHFLVWVALGLIFGLLPGIGLPTGAAYRWILILVIPLAVLFFEGATRLLSARNVWCKRFGGIAIATLLLLSIVFSTGYLGLNNTTEIYFGVAPQYRPLMPVTMIESTLTIRDVSSLVAIALWANRTLPTSSVLILPFQLYGWYLAVVSGNHGLLYRPTGLERNLDDTISLLRPGTGPKPIYARNVDMYRPQDATILASLATQASNSGRVYVVWWSQNSTAGISSNLLNTFSVEYTNGNLAVLGFLTA